MDVEPGKRDYNSGKISEINEYNSLCLSEKTDLLLANLVFRRLALGPWMTQCLIYSMLSCFWLRTTLGICTPHADANK